ncbi:MAG: hypothetical protein M1834_001080 [Cirrosporium novae-zelandiae]|nr:MAG: hypothetical protein M1834_001080 [Cirrosporium novae-zelandiae]
MNSSDHNEYVSTLVKEVNSATAALDKADVFGDNNARMKALEASKKLTRALETPMDVIFDHAVTDLPTNMCLRMGVDLQIFRNICASGDNPSTAKSLAASADADYILVVQILRVLSATGHVKEIGVERYKASALTKALTDPLIESSVKICFDIGNLCVAKAPEFFRRKGFKYPTTSSDTPFQLAFNTDMDYFPYADKHGMTKDFHAWMELNQRGKPNWVDWFPIQRQLIDGFDAKQSDVLLIDIGGGQGKYLKLFKEKFLDAPGRLILQELPYAVEAARLNKNDGIEGVPYDFFTPQPVKGARTYFLHWVLHDWSDEQASKILQNIVAAMTPNYSKLIINESVLPDENCPMGYASMGIMMMTQLASLERSQKQWNELLEKVGLQVVKFHEPPVSGIPGEGVIEAVKV